MKDRDIFDILSEKQLRKTKIRQELLQLFQKKNYAISYQDITNELNSVYDMATIYRTLNTFEGKNIIHRVPCESAHAHFALTTLREESSDNNMHLICRECGHTFCIHDFNADSLATCNNFKIDSVSIVAKGLCNSCKGNNNEDK